MTIARGPVSTVAFCWQVERRDGAGLGLTSHDEDLVLGGIRYRSAPGILPSAIVRGSGLDAPAGDIQGALSSPALTQDELVAGRWDAARVRLFAVDWENPEDGDIPLVEGELGELSYSGEQFSAELLGAASKLNAAVCPETSPQCRAQFGDRQCRVDLAGRRRRVAVTAIDGVCVTIDSVADDRYAFGRLRWLRGPLTGCDSVILSASGQQLRLREPPRADGPFPLIAEIREGCDKTFATCVGRFSNGVNFRGEPHLPGNDMLTRYPGAN